MAHILYSEFSIFLNRNTIINGVNSVLVMYVKVSYYWSCMYYKHVLYCNNSTETISVIEFCNNVIQSSEEE